MAGGSGKRARRLSDGHGPEMDPLHSDINVTPLVDVCLVLLIIFMVIAPMLARGKEVPLPATKHHSTEKDRQQPIVAIDRDRTSGEYKYYVDKDEIPVGADGAPGRFKALTAKVEKEWNSLGELSEGAGRVFLKVNKEVPYGKVYPVIMALHELGTAGIDLGTNEQKEQKAASE